MPTVVPPELLELLLLEPLLELPLLELLLELLLLELLLEIPLELALFGLLGATVVEDPPPPHPCSNGTLKSSTQMRS